MRRIIKLGMIAALVAAVGYAAAATAANARTTTTRTPTKKEHKTHIWSVETVDAQAGTVTLSCSDGSPSKTLKVTAATRLTVGGKSGVKLDAVKPGMRAVFTTSGRDALSSLQVSQPK